MRLDKYRKEKKEYYHSGVVLTKEQHEFIKKNKLNLSLIVRDRINIMMLQNR